MKRRLAVAAALLTTATTALAAEDPLKLCLDENVPPIPSNPKSTSR